MTNSIIKIIHKLLLVETENRGTRIENWCTGIQKRGLRPKKRGRGRRVCWGPRQIQGVWRCDTEEGQHHHKEDKGGRAALLESGREKMTWGEREVKEKIKLRGRGNVLLGGEREGNRGQRTKRGWSSWRMYHRTRVGSRHAHKCWSSIVSCRWTALHATRIGNQPLN